MLKATEISGLRDCNKSCLMHILILFLPLPTLVSLGFCQGHTVVCGRAVAESHSGQVAGLAPLLISPAICRSCKMLQDSGLALEVLTAGGRRDWEQVMEVQQAQGSAD